MCEIQEKVELRKKKKKVPSALSFFFFLPTSAEQHLGSVLP